MLTYTMTKLEPNDKWIIPRKALPTSVFLGYNQTKQELPHHLGNISSQLSMYLLPPSVIMLSG